MKNIEIFVMQGCPYCKNAEKALAELVKEHPEYGQAAVEWIEENRYPERTEGHDYYYVPSIFCEGKKLYEAHPGDEYVYIREKVREALEYAL